MGVVCLRGLVAVAVLCSAWPPIAAEDSTQGHACHDREEAEAESVKSQMLQHHRSLRAPTKELPLPVTWMHIPRTGSTFAYTLLQIEGVCDWGMALDLFGTIPLDTGSVQDHCPGWDIPLSLLGCARVADFLRCTEQGIGIDWSRREGSVVTFFRQPEERLVSEWNWEIQGLGHYFPDILEFVTARQGCGVKILTGDDKWEHHCDDGPPTWDQVEVAKARLETGFAFIGLTTQWNVSICLFNTMFGTPCHGSQFESWSGHITTTNSSDVTLLDGFVDKYDAVLWEVAQRKFQEELDLYHVSEETCVPCVGGMTDDQDEAPALSPPSLPMARLGH